MKIAIHNRRGSFSDKWIEYCNKNNINYLIVDCYASNIISQIQDCDAILWHWTHGEYKDVLIARSIIKSIENTGKLVYPNYNTCWHYDDKIAQKYLLESINAPLVETNVFYSLNEAIEWIDKNIFPKVFKLRTGAGSQNVKLVKNRNQAIKLSKKAFLKGFDTYGGYFTDIETKLRKTRINKNYVDKIKRFNKIFWGNRRKYKIFPKQIGYIYFQEFLPNNEYDTRIVIIGNRAFCLRRFNRPSDFRASGGGFLNYDKDAIDKRFVNIAFEISKILKFQTMAYDFLYNLNGEPKICEISYGFPKGNFLEDCPGYWDDRLNWIEGNCVPEYLIIEDIIKNL